MISYQMRVLTLSKALNFVFYDFASDTDNGIESRMMMVKEYARIEVPLSSHISSTPFTSMD